MMRHESQYQVLEVKDPELAKTLRMEPGRFYCYHKPSYINGFERYVDYDVNLEYIQAVEGACRAELAVNPQTIEEYRGKLITESLTNTSFTKVFKREQTNV